jgi:ribose transport system substrate-binding protein
MRQYAPTAHAVVLGGLALGLMSGMIPAHAADDQLVAKAKKLVGEATTGLVASNKPKTPELELTIDDFEPVTGWVGPKTPVQAPEKKKIVAISCATVAPFCANVTQGAVEAAKALGWDATYIDGKASINGYVQAFETAINMKPDGIITMALPESQLATYIAKAHAAGIKLVGASSIPEKVSVENGKYDAYVSVREDSNTLLQAWYTIADSDGKAKVTWMWDPGYPFLVAALERSKKIIAECSGCKAEEVGLREFASAANPVRMQELGAGLLSRNPDAEYVLTAYGLNSHSIALAAKAMGRNVKVVAKNADPNNVAFVSQGELQAEVGASSNWGGWAAVDQMVRLLAGQQPLDIMEENQPEHIFVTSNAPADGVLDFQKLYDYKGKYLELWGRK